MSTQKSRNIFVEELCKYFMVFLQTGFKSTRFPKRYIRSNSEKNFKIGIDLSKYAKQYPDREDIAETINWWIAVRCKVDRISKSNYKKIIEAIPNRLKYLDEKNYDTYPLVCKK